MNCVIFLLLYACFGICYSLGVCSQNKRITSQDRTFYFKKYFCCNNYEKHGMGCQHCSIGFTSSGGSSCFPCPGGLFGFRCAEKCDCHINQRCDTMTGCVMSFDTSINDTENIYYGKDSNSTGDALNQGKLDSMQIQVVLIYVICTGTLTLLVTIGAIFFTTRSKRSQKKNLK